MLEYVCAIILISGKKLIFYTLYINQDSLGYAWGTTKLKISVANITKVYIYLTQNLLQIKVMLKITYPPCSPTSIQTDGICYLLSCTKRDYYRDLLPLTILRLKSDTNHFCLQQNNTHMALTNSKGPYKFWSSYCSRMRRISDRGELEISTMSLRHLSNSPLNDIFFLLLNYKPLEGRDYFWFFPNSTHLPMPL